MRYVIMFVLAALLSVGCGSSTESTPPPNNGTGDGTGTGTGDGTDNGAGNEGTGGQARTAAVAADNALFSRVEGTDAKNDCAADADCKPSGCSKEVCAAEELMTACDVQAWPQGEGASCGCVNKQCIWYR
jgi:eight-cysteine-cluster-containing protein